MMSAPVCLCRMDDGGRRMSTWKVPSGGGKLAQDGIAGDHLTNRPVTTQEDGV